MVGCTRAPIPGDDAVSTIFWETLTFAYHECDTRPNTLQHTVSSEAQLIDQQKRVVTHTIRDVILEAKTVVTRAEHILRND